MKARCTSCLYFGHRTRTCDYLLITGQRRGCPPDRCTRYVQSEQAARLAQEYAGTKALSELESRLLSLYEQGLSDSEIARELQRSRRLVIHYRSKLGLPSRSELWREEEDDEDNGL